MKLEAYAGKLHAPRHSGNFSPAWLSDPSSSWHTGAIVIKHFTVCWKLATSAVLTLAYITLVQLEHLQEFPKLTPKLEFLARLNKTVLQQLLIWTLNLSALGEIDLIVLKYTCAYQSPNMEVEDVGKIKSKDRVPNANIEERKKV